MRKQLTRFKSPAHQFIDIQLSKCTSMIQLKQLHAQLIVQGLAGEILTAGKLVAFCAVSDAGDIRHARQVFDRVPHPNRFMWNSLIRGLSGTDHREALTLHRQMLCAGVLPNAFTLPFVLKSCAAESSFSELQMVHSLIFKLGFKSNVFVMNVLLYGYAQCGLIELAHKVFDEIPQRSIVSWNSIIDGYSRFGNLQKVFDLFKVMRELGYEPDGFTLVSLLSICSRTGNLAFGRLVHHYIEMTGFGIYLILGNALVDMYGKCGELHAARACFEKMPTRNVVSWTAMVCAFARHGMVDLARCLFDRMPERNVISWNAMLACYVQCGQCREGLFFYDQMQTSGVSLDEAALASALSACSQIGDLAKGKQIHEDICENIKQPGVTIYNAIVDMYAKCGSLDTALDLFDSIPRKNVVSWNVIMGALAMHGHANEAVRLFGDMVAKGFQPDGITFTCLLSACSHGGLMEVGNHYFEVMNHEYKVPHEIEHYACMVDLFGRGGLIGKAVELIQTMPMRPDVIVWGALLGACRIHSNVRIGSQIMKHLLEAEQCSGGPYVLMSNMYSESHRWEDMKGIRKLMGYRGIRKDAATSLIEITGVVHKFLAEDSRHERGGDVYLLLDQLTHHLMSTRYSQDISGTYVNVEEC